ncbi:MAG: helix-turn-helix transcriptional regulator [Actinobacteria bacterium]|nr:helix-turn-helix transcriptional regulator [Actinomycetota bacterium]
MRTYAQFCPIAKATEVLGERWSILIIRELLNGSSRFNEFARGLPGISRALLSKRLQQLQRAGVIARTHDGYELTSAGAELEPLLIALGEWGVRHAFPDPRPEELDPDLLLWWMHRRLDRSAMPDSRTVVQFRFSDARQGYWLVLEPDDVSICRTDPGFEVDVVVNSDVTTMYEVWLGRRDLYDALSAGSVTLDGRPAMTRAFPRWLQFSPLADAVRSERALGQ